MTGFLSERGLLLFNLKVRKEIFVPTGITFKHTVILSIRKWQTWPSLCILELHQLGLWLPGWWEVRRGHWEANLPSSLGPSTLWPSGWCHHGQCDIIWPDYKALKNRICCQFILHSVWYREIDNTLNTEQDKGRNLIFIKHMLCHHARHSNLSLYLIPRTIIWCRHYCPPFASEVE